MRIIIGIGVVLAVMLATGCGQPTIEDRYAALTAVAEGTRVAILEAEVAATATAVVAHMTATPTATPSPTSTATPMIVICITEGRAVFGLEGEVRIIEDAEDIVVALPLSVPEGGGILPSPSGTPTSLATAREVVTVDGTVVRAMQTGRGSKVAFDGEGKMVTHLRDCTAR